MSVQKGSLSDQKSVACLRSIGFQSLFKQALSDLYSSRYFQHHRKAFAKVLFIFEIKFDNRSWGLMKDDEEIREFFENNQLRSALSEPTRLSLQNIQDFSEEEQGNVLEEVFCELLKSKTDILNLPFFQADREGFGKFVMKKRSGGRYKQATCCKLGSIFQRWKERTVTIFEKGVAYYNQRGQIRQFLSFSHGFHFQFGKPSTGLQFGLTLYANHRQLSLQALNVKDFVYFIFTLRSSCKNSCYMSLNRFNSFAPLRYESEAKFFVDGEDYFGALFDSFERAQKSILMMGWMISPEFLLKRKADKISLQDVLFKIAAKGVRIKIILYYQTCFLSNGSLYTKNRLQSNKNITVLRHPCGKLPVLWSHHGKLVIVDERQAFVGGLDVCYGRFDSQSHEMFPPSHQYPGLEHNNIRKNDQWDVKFPKQLSIGRHQCRLPWHDVSQGLKGPVVADLSHHFYQMWNFIRYQNCLQPQDTYTPSLFEADVKSVFSTKIIPVEQQDSGILKTLQNGFATMKKKGKRLMETMKTKIVGEERRESSQLRLSATQDYFGKYVKQIATEIEKKKKTSVGRPHNQKGMRNSGSRSQRYSISEMKQVKLTLENDCAKQQGPTKGNSFLLTGNKLIDFMAVEIDKDYISCLEKVKSNIQPSQQDGEMKQIESDEQYSHTNDAAFENGVNFVSSGRDQCQVVRSVGNWSMGCHSSNTQFSIQIAYLQLISQAKHYIYIQNQFFISSLANSKLVRNEVAEALYLRIKKAIENNQRFMVYVVLPLIPGFSGNLEVEDCLLLRKQMQWQYDTICRGEDSIWQKLLNYTNDPSRYIQFLGLRTHGRFNADSIPQTQIIYVHSKIMLVDDESILCGSANINDRSLLGDRDSEIAVITRGEDFVSGVMNGEPALVSQIAQQLRIKLWMEHFGFSQGEALDPISDQTWQLVAERAASNTEIYRRVFGCYPDDEMTTRKLIEQRKQQSNIELYQELIVHIKGHIVQFPLHFLQDEPLTCLLTEKQFYVPTECLT